MPRKVEDPKWSDPGLLVIASLAGGARHGYAIIQDVAETTGVQLGPGTLYGALSRLEERGLIEPLEADESRRRPYRLTTRGTAVLEDQLEAMSRFAALGRRRLDVATSRVGWAGA